MNIFETMYRIVCGDVNVGIDINSDVVLKAAIDNTIQTMEYIHLEKVTEKTIAIQKVSDTDAVGMITLSGTALSDDLKDGDHYRIVEQRVIGNLTYYLFIIVVANPKKNDDVIPLKPSDTQLQSAVDNASILLLQLDGLSRMIDYYLDCVCKESVTMTELNIRDGIRSEDPAIVIAKAILLYNSEYGRKIFSYPNHEGEDMEQTEEEAQKEIMTWFNTVDILLTKNLRTDWIHVTSIKSAEKAKIFAPQSNLISEIYHLANDIRHEDLSIFKANYEDLFLQGSIYNLAGYSWISKFLALGTTPFSTDVYNTEWKKYM